MRFLGTIIVGSGKLQTSVTLASHSGRITANPEVIPQPDRIGPVKRDSRKVAFSRSGSPSQWRVWWTSNTAFLGQVGVMQGGESRFLRSWGGLGTTSEVGILPTNLGEILGPTRESDV